MSFVAGWPAVPLPDGPWLVGLAAAPVLAASALLPADDRALVALAFIIVLGVPHGALDGEIARDLLRPRFGRWWFAVFAPPCLLLSAGVVAAWAAAPLVTLAAFLAVSAWHFGMEERDGAGPVEVLARGGLPIAVPTLAHPAATAHVFAVVSGVHMIAPPAVLTLASLAWAGVAFAWAIRVTAATWGAVMIRPAVLLLLFLVLPPLTAFAIYFVAVHAPAHTGALVADAQRAVRVRDGRSAARLAMPLTMLTVALGAALWPLYVGQPADRLLALTIQGLAALTLPHLLLDLGWPVLAQRPSLRPRMPARALHPGHARPTPLR